MIRRCLYIRSSSSYTKSVRFSSNLSEDEILHKSYQGMLPGMMELAKLNDAKLNVIKEEYEAKGVLERGPYFNFAWAGSLYSGNMASLCYLPGYHIIVHVYY